MLERRLNVAKPLAHQSGAMLQSVYSLTKTVTHKARNNPLTGYDLLFEEIIVEGLREAFPDDAIVAEEAHHDPERDDYWLVDPIDGTTNFAHGLPDFTISIAFLQHGKPQMGVIYVPARGEIFRAIHGGGAWVNDTPIHVSNESDVGSVCSPPDFRTICRQQISISSERGNVYSTDPRAFVTPDAHRSIQSMSRAACWKLSGKLDFSPGTWPPGS